MRSITTGLFVVGTLCVAGLAAGQTQDKKAPAGIAELIKNLGSPKFAERELATKKLDAIGPVALPMLRVALKSEDAETRRRAEILVRKFEDQELTTKLLAGKRVRLNVKDVTIADAVAELSKLSYVVTLPQELEAHKHTKITLDTGETTFWEALHKLGAKITEATPDAKESPSIKTAPTNKFAIDFGFPEQAQIICPIPTGKALSNPVFFAGSVRVMLLKAESLPSGEIEVFLEFACEPDLLDFANAGSPRIDKASDGEGKQLALQLTPNPPFPNAIGAGAAGQIFKAGGPPVIIRDGIPAALNPQPQSGFRSFIIPMRLSGGKNPLKSLAELSGKMAVQTTVESDPLLVVDDILKAAGKSVKNRDDKTLKVLAVDMSAKGEVTVKVAMEFASPLNQLAAGGGRVQVFQLQQAQVNGNVIVQVNPNGLPMGGASSILRLLDDNDMEFTQTGVPTSSMEFGGSKLTQNETVVFTPKPGQRAASRLVVPGFRTFSFDVPFSFKDVTLPVGEASVKGVQW